MRKAVGAVLFHCSEAVDSASKHQFCPRSSTSWCKYPVDQVKCTSDYVEKRGLPIPLRRICRSVLRFLYATCPNCGFDISLRRDRDFFSFSSFCHFLVEKFQIILISVQFEPRIAGKKSLCHGVKHNVFDTYAHGHGQI